MGQPKSSCYLLQTPGCIRVKALVKTVLEYKRDLIMRRGELLPKNPTESRVEMTGDGSSSTHQCVGYGLWGVVMSWVDIAAAIVAQRHSGKLVVTASIDAMHFLAPIAWMGS